MLKCVHGATDQHASNPTISFTSMLKGKGVTYRVDRRTTAAAIGWDS